MSGNQVYAYTSTIIHTLNILSQNDTGAGSGGAAVGACKWKYRTNYINNSIKNINKLLKHYPLNTTFSLCFAFW